MVVIRLISADSARERTAQLPDQAWSLVRDLPAERDIPLELGLVAIEMTHAGERRVVLRTDEQWGAALMMAHGAGLAARELTEDEVRSALLRHVWHMIDFWEREDRCPGTREKLEGFAFSMLAALDGSSTAVPGFVVAPRPHPDDRQYHADHDEDWYPENHDSDVVCDIGGSLHELFQSHNPAHDDASAS